MSHHKHQDHTHKKKEACGLPGCGKEATCRCKGCKIASYCSIEHQAIDWTSHYVECNLNVCANSANATWTTEEEIGHEVGEEAQEWAPSNLVHAHECSVTGLIGQLAQNEDIIEQRNETIEGFADFGSDVALTRGMQHLPSGGMHRGEEVELFVKIGDVSATITGIKLPKNASYNVFLANKGYSVFLSKRDIQASRKFSNVPASGEVAVGLGTDDQKALVFGTYSVVKTAPLTLREGAIGMLNSALRMPNKIRLKAFDQKTQMMACVMLEQDVSVRYKANPGTEPTYSITHVEIYVPESYTKGHRPETSWDNVLTKEKRDAQSAPQKRQSLLLAANDDAPPAVPARDDADMAAAIGEFADALVEYAMETSDHSAIAHLPLLSELIGHERSDRMTAMESAFATDQFYSWDGAANQFVPWQEGVSQSKYHWTGSMMNAIVPHQAFSGRGDVWLDGAPGLPVNAQMIGAAANAGVQLVNKAAYMRGPGGANQWLPYKDGSGARKFLYEAPKKGGFSTTARGWMREVAAPPVQKKEAAAAPAAAPAAEPTPEAEGDKVEALIGRFADWTFEGGDERIAYIEGIFNRLKNAVKGKLQKSVQRGKQDWAINKMNDLGQIRTKWEAAVAAATNRRSNGQQATDLVDYAVALMQRYGIVDTKYDANVPGLSELRRKTKALNSTRFQAFNKAVRSKRAAAADARNSANADPEPEQDAGEAEAEPAQAEIGREFADLEPIEGIFNRMKNRAKDWVLRRRKAAIQNRALNYKKKDELLKLLKVNVEEAEARRKNGDQVKDRVEYAMALLEALDRKDVTLAELGDYGDRARKLNNTKGQAFRDSVNQTRADRAEASENAALNSAIDAESLEDMVALTDALVQLQQEVRADYAELSADPEVRATAEFKAFEAQMKELSRVRGVIHGHVMALHADEQGHADYDEIGVAVHEAVNQAQDDFLGNERIEGIFNRLKNAVKNRVQRSVKRGKQDWEINKLSANAIFTRWSNVLDTIKERRANKEQATDDVDYAMALMKAHDVKYDPVDKPLASTDQTKLNAMIRATKGYNSTRFNAFNNSVREKHAARSQASEESLTADE